MFALVVAAVVLALSGRGYAVDPDRALSQYLRDSWGSEKGFPGGPVYSITQTPDGYLWVGADKGLVRFDGLTFKLLEPTGLVQGAGPTALGVAAAPDGSLWARLRGVGLVREHAGTFESMLEGIGLPESVVTAMYRGEGDVFLIATLGHGTVSYRDGKFSKVAQAATIPTSSFVISITQTTDGDVWLGTRDAGLLRVQGAKVTRIMDGLPDLKINCLLSDARGGLWIGTDKGVAHWDGQRVTRAGVPSGLDDVPAIAMIRDREANVWIAAGSRGLFRVSPNGLTMTDDRTGRLAGAVSTVFEDREGNIWIGTSKGIERLRDGVFRTYGSTQGLPSDSVGPVYVDAAQRTWFAPPEGGLYWTREGHVERIDLAGLPNDVVYSIAGSGNDVWVGRQRGGLTRLAWSGDVLTAERLTDADGLAQNSVYVVHQARDQSVWAGTLSGGASRFKAGVFTTFTRANGLASNTIATIIDTADGAMWFGTPNGVSTLSRGGWRTYSTRDGLPSNDVNVLFEDAARNVWVGTAAGLAVIRDGQLRVPANMPSGLRSAVLGVAEDRRGWLWFATPDGIVRVYRDAIALDGASEVPLRSYGMADGLMAFDGVKRHRSVVSDAAGRIWFSMSRGLSVVDPALAERKTLPALVQIEEVSADGESLPLNGHLLIPAGRRRVAVSYAGLSLAVPERVRYRYRLDGFDQDWSEPVTERQAAYTNLAPGPYVFRVAASSADEAWSSTEAVMRFEVQPQAWQTAGFRVSALLLTMVVGWAVYRLRLMRVARQLNSRFEERLAERTRIAQELHDTLLQGFVSASMQLHVTADRLPSDSPARPALVHVLDLMARVIEEGRNAVRGLRSSSSAPHDLQLAFSGLQQELAFADHVDFRVIVEGRVRRLKPMVRDDVYRIGREALVNAFRHSGAGTIEIELEYGPRQLRLFVRDDGCGIDPQTALTGSEGHWGIAGMHERARSIGGTLKVLSRASAGTEIELSVPANAYDDEGSVALHVRFANLLGRMAGRRTHDHTESES